MENCVNNIKLNYGFFLKKIFKYLNLKFNYEKINKETTKISIFKNDKCVWFENDMKDFSSEFDEYYAKNFEFNLLYETFFNFIYVNKKYNIMMRDNNNNVINLLTIPEFVSIEELALKLEIILH
jgi:hypothetical protein